MKSETTGADILPEGFEGLAPFLAWNLATPDERQDRRRRSSSEELTTFYHGALPRMDAILAVLGQYQLGELPPQYRPLFNLALALAEVAPHVELYGGDPAVPHSFAEDRMIAAHGRQETWRGLLPMAG